MAKHMLQNHPEVPPAERNFTAKILSCNRTTLSRFVDEALRLEKVPNLANSKREWGCGGLIRLQVTRTQDRVPTKTGNSSQITAINPTLHIPLDQSGEGACNNTNSPAREMEFQDLPIPIYNLRPRIKASTLQEPG